MVRFKRRLHPRDVSASSELVESNPRHPHFCSTCAWIASKLEDKNAPSVEDFVWIADYSFTCNRLRALEEQVCRELEFRLSCVTPYHFVNLFLRASNACPNGSCEFDHPVLRQVVMYLLALSRLSYHLSLCKPSLLAAAAVYLARATVGIRESDPSHSVHPEGYWTRTLQYYTSYKREDLRGAVLIIHRYQLVAETAENIKGLFTKFSKSSHHFASLKTAVRFINTSCCCSCCTQTAIRSPHGLVLT